MKKVNFKTVMMVLSFATAFLFLGVGSVQAQITPVSPGAVKGVTTSLPQGNFVDSDFAKQKLSDAHEQIKGFVANSIPGSANYINAVRLARYYSAIWHDLSNNQTSVPQAINNGFNGFEAADGLTPAIMTSLRNDAIALLSN